MNDLSPPHRTSSSLLYAVCNSRLCRNHVVTSVPQNTVSPVSLPSHPPSTRFILSLSSIDRRQHPEACRIVSVTTSRSWSPRSFLKSPLRPPFEAHHLSLFFSPWLDRTAPLGYRSVVTYPLVPLLPLCPLLLFRSSMSFVPNSPFTLESSPSLSLSMDSFLVNKQFFPNSRLARESEFLGTSRIGDSPCENARSPSSQLLIPFHTTTTNSRLSLASHGTLRPRVQLYV